MKKLIKEIKNYHPNHAFLILYLYIPIVVASLIPYKVLDNDRFFLLALGRNILNNGFPKVDPLSMHGASFIAQQWLSDIIFYIIYKYFGNVGLVILTYLLFGLMISLFYRLCNLVNKNKYTLSTILTLTFSGIYLMAFLRSRPQLFEASILIEELYLLEKYISTKEKKYLYYLPLLSLLMINIHASCFFIMFAFMLPYLLNFKTKFTNYEKYEIKPLIITTVIMFLTGFINPYGYKSITYLFHSYGYKEINRLVLEMNPLTLNNYLGYILFALVIIIVFIYIFLRKKLKLRYIFLFLGTLFLSLSHVKGIQYFLFASIFPLGDVLSNYFISNKSKISGKTKVYYYIVLIVMILLPIVNLIIHNDYPSGESEPTRILEYLNENVEDKESVKIYTDYNTGGFFEFYGYKVYLDPRAEVFLENGVLLEYNKVEMGLINYDEFLDKYDFDYLVVDGGNVFTRQYLITSRNTKYRVVLTDIIDEKKQVGYNLYEKVS